MTQPHHELEKFYQTPDPWGYKTNPCDINRMTIIVNVLRCFFPKIEHNGLISFFQFKKALDIGAGEGWITKNLPANERYGYELSDTAAERFPSNVKRVKRFDLDANDMKFDLVTTTGTLYSHYEYQTFLHLIKQHATDIVLTCNIKNWEVSDVKNIGKQIFEAEFPYREYTQKLRVFKV